MEHATPPEDAPAGPAPIARTARYVVVGATPLAQAVCAGLEDGGAEVAHLESVDDEVLRVRLVGAAGLAILLHDDHEALRYTLAAAHVAPAVPVVASIFDRTVAGQLAAMVPWCALSTPGNLVAPSLAGPCLAADIVAARAGVDGAVGSVCRRDGEALVSGPYLQDAGQRWRQRWHRWSGQLRVPDVGSRILLAGLGGLLLVLLADTAYLAWHEHLSPAVAFFEAARVIATVGPASAEHASTDYLVASSVAMLATVVLTAAFTAGVVERLLGPRLVSIVGRRALPRTGHVVVVGLGQVGLRLCQELRGFGVPVVAVERSSSAPSVRLAARMGIPVVIGDGEDRAVLELVRLPRARALAAVGSDDIDNIAVAVAAHAVGPGIRVVLRAGQHEAITETRSLLPLGITRDVTAAAATWVLAQLVGERPGRLVADVHDVWLDLPGQGLVRRAAPARACRHVQGAADAG